MVRRCQWQAGCNSGSINLKASPNKPVLPMPTDSVQTWKDRGNGDKKDDSLWRPVTLAGSVLLGDVAIYRCRKPSFEMAWCVREDFAGAKTVLATSFWDIVTVQPTSAMC